MKPGFTLVLDRPLVLSTPSPECAGMIQLRQALRHLLVNPENVECRVYHTGGQEHGRLLGFDLYRWPGTTTAFDRWLDQEIGI